MVKKYTNTYCDICMSNGREVLGSHFGNVPVYFQNDETYRNVDMDLCETCKQKISNVVGVITYKGNVYSFKNEGN